MYQGYIKLWRKIQDSDSWTEEKFTRSQAWIDLIILANHKSGHIRLRGIKVNIDRGQLAYSELSLAKRWKWSRGKVRRFLKELSSNPVQQIIQQTNNLTSLISIVNYNQYQGTEQQTVQQTVQQTDTKRYTNKNDKNEKNKEKEIYKEKESFGEFENVELTKAEIQKLQTRFGDIETQTVIERLSGYIESSGKKYKSHYATILNWKRRDEGDGKIEPKTYAQAQDAERRTMVKMLKEMNNVSEQDGDSERINQAPHLLSHGKEID